MHSGRIWGSVEEGAEEPSAREKVFAAAPARSSERSVSCKGPRVGTTHSTGENAKGMEEDLQTDKRPQDLSKVRC